MLRPQRVSAVLLPDPSQPRPWCPYHGHAGQLDLGLVGWDQGDGDTGSDRDGGARGLDGAAWWRRDPQLQLQRRVDLCRALGTEQGGQVKFQTGQVLLPGESTGRRGGSTIWEPRDTNAKTGLASGTLQNCVQPLPLLRQGNVSF